MFLIVLTNYRFSIFVLLLDVAFVVMIFQQLKVNQLYLLYKSFNPKEPFSETDIQIESAKVLFL